MDTLNPVFSPPSQSSGSAIATAKKNEPSSGFVSTITTAPTQLPKQQDPNNPEHKQDISNAVKDINNFFQMSQRSLDFSLDEASGHMVLQIKDTVTNEVIRQIPGEEALVLAKRLDDLTGLLFKAQA
jgi:flagellar protein FlaG